MDKETLRAKLKGERAAVPGAVRKKRDAMIVDQLQNWPPYREAERVFVYLSVGWEIDTWAIVDNLIARGRKAYAPVIQNNPRALLPRLYTSRADLIPGVFGILEPPVEAPGVSPHELDLIIVPGLAFSRNGYRIGYGGGFYDRFLASSPAPSVGLCYHEFLRAVPIDGWDKPVSHIATELGVLGRK